MKENLRILEVTSAPIKETEKRWVPRPGIPNLPRDEEPVSIVEEDKEKKENLTREELLNELFQKSKNSNDFFEHLVKDDEAFEAMLMDYLDSADEETIDWIRTLRKTNPEEMKKYWKYFVTTSEQKADQVWDNIPEPEDEHFFKPQETEESIEKLQIELTEAISTMDVDNLHRLCRDHQQELRLKGESPLHLAVLLSNYELADIIISKYRADVNEVNFTRTTPLHHACIRGDLKIIKLLLKHGAYTNLGDDEGVSPLHLLIQTKASSEVVSLLLNEGKADANIMDDEGNTPLHVAASNGNVGLARLLLKHGARVSSTNSDEHTALHLACKEGQVEIVKLLLEERYPGYPSDLKIFINSPGIHKITPLHLAIVSEKEEVATYLLQTCAKKSFLNCLDVEVKDTSGNTPLHLAAATGKAKAASILIDVYNVSLTIKNELDYMPLHLACQYGKLECVQLFLSKGAPVNAQSESGASPLLLALDGGFVENKDTIEEIVKIMIVYKADINLADQEGNTPLMIAAQNGLLGIVKGMLILKADSNAKTSNHVRAIHLAMQEGYWDIARDLVAFGADPTHTTIEGYNTIHLAAQRSKKEWIDYLVSCGMDINFMANDGSTALSIAKQNRDNDFVNFLIQKGAREIDVFEIAESNYKKNHPIKEL